MKPFNYRCTFFDIGSTLCFVPTKGDFSFLNVSVDRLPKETVTQMMARLMDILSTYKAQIFMQWVFGGFDSEKGRSEKSQIQKFLKEHQMQDPIWLVGDGHPSAKCVGSQVIAIIQKRANMSFKLNDDGSFNKSFSDKYGRYTLWCGNPKLNQTLSRDEKVRQHFELAETLPSGKKEDSFQSVARTWIYLDQLLTWYDPFNETRNTFFNDRDLYNLKTIPSSTGIGAQNIAKNPMSLSTLMIEPKDKSVTFKAVPSPLQCPALNYKSSFSRAHLIDHPHFKWLLISGTASILPAGESIYIDDIEKQIELTMDVVAAILAEQKMTWHDVTRSIVYIKDPSYAKAFYDWCEKNDVEFLTSIFKCDVCRDELLFEIELDAMVTQ